MKILCLLFCIESAVAAPAALDSLINIALQNNLALQQRTMAWEKAWRAQQAAQGMFLPTVSLEARYSRAEGGRQIDFPIGDIVNPIYSSLNMLMQQPVFPTNVPNETIPFLREREHETRLRVVQPVLQPAIYYNLQIQSLLKDIHYDARRVYARQLVADVKQAYYDVLKTQKVLVLYDSTRVLVEENLHVSTVLFENDKVTEADVFRAKAELADQHQQQAKARKNAQLARAQLNFLLNRDLDTPIAVEALPKQEPSPALYDEALSAAMERREELKQLETSINVSQKQISLQRSSYLPTVSVVADYGYQGTEYRFDDRHDYWMISAVASWTLFHGLQTKRQVQQAKLDKRQQQARLQEVRQQIELQIKAAYENLTVAREARQAAATQQKSAAKAFRIISGKYKQGMISQIELLSARNALTQAEINRILTTYDYWSRWAVWEQALAVYPIQLGD
ncbi:hypothetical protein GF406_14755 [candidate division KSB1 bacterium]|nr:hypothetical protein [candidate division KSB1 bacterium]